MILLDTDHISVLQRSSDAADALQQRLVDSGQPIATTAITLEEQTRSWISLIGREREVADQVRWYERLVAMFDFFGQWDVVSFSPESALKYERFRKARVRISATDLKIASIAVAESALLLTANKKDFEQVPTLRFENWLGR